METFNIQPCLDGDDVSVRPLDINDYEKLFSVALDRLIWAGHPSKHRYLEKEFLEWFKSALDSNAALVVLDRPGKEIIGSTRFYFPPEKGMDLSIGFTFLARKHWGGATNFKVKSIMLNYAFTWYEAVWFHVAPSNIRSQKSVEKFGAVFVVEEILKLGNKPENWFCYRISRNDWRTNCAKSC